MGAWLVALTGDGRFVAVDSAGEVGVRIHLRALLHNLVASAEPAYYADCAKVLNRFELPT